MMTEWLDACDVAERLKVGRTTALSLMQEMRHVVIGGNVRKRIRVSAEEFEAWMEGRSLGKSLRTGSAKCGSRKRLERR